MREQDSHAFGEVYSTPNHAQPGMSEESRDAGRPQTLEPVRKRRPIPLVPALWLPLELWLSTLVAHWNHLGESQNLLDLVIACPENLLFWSGVQFTLGLSSSQRDSNLWP